VKWNPHAKVFQLAPVVVGNVLTGRQAKQSNTRDKWTSTPHVQVKHRYEIFILPETVQAVSSPSVCS